jgi:hypothetical protein
MGKCFRRLQITNKNLSIGPIAGKTAVLCMFLVIFGGFLRVIYRFFVKDQKWLTSQNAACKRSLAGCLK